ncbi:adenylate/guanylate cyclase domain-containing protein [Sulfitobacter aestuariivivens]|uniref:Adenylate/guanylate cyclase domain-containing protein n=1 Tax=Sulfitobacter aestuariivivens TaxID=2766981 RepID=A0A927D739_9RHOB|nr:adenylate/guanylate cyclase domain-containing protein [Sulfitobacter aestuariivivens]MBD3664757.1 adenylate/guanylate cyclase domain-containing protein [Sulfitobacter aestuariivivens]
MLETIKKWFFAEAEYGLDALPEHERSGRYAFNLATLMGGIATIPYVIAYFLAGATLLGFVVAPVMLNVLAPRIIARMQPFSALFLIGSVFITCFVTATYLTGASSGLYLFMLHGLLSLALQQASLTRGQMVLLVSLVFSAIAASYLLFPNPSGLLDVGETFNRIVFFSTLTVMSLQIFVILYSMSRKVTEAEAALAAEHARSEALLQNLLPDNIAARLKDRPGEVIADGLPAVTLLFADIVDFTPRSARMPPEELIGWLNRIFSAFDVLTAERGLEKIKTIGDAYMVAAGLPVAREDHAAVIADMALAMQAEVVRLSEELGEPVDLRIGIHSGPAIAGVIGTSKVFYDVWGDTVNTASRMESHGEPGRIQVTEPTRLLLQDAFAFTERGPVEIKGVGIVKTWWLDGPRA